MRKADLIAKPGMIYTNGTDYGKMIFLAEGVDASDYYEITEDEYNEKMEAEMAETMPE